MVFHLKMALLYYFTQTHNVTLTLVSKWWVTQCWKMATHHQCMPSLFSGGARLPALGSQSSRLLARECWEYPERKGKWHHSADLPYQAGSPGAACMKANKQAHTWAHSQTELMTHSDTSVCLQRGTEVPMNGEEAITSISSAENFPTVWTHHKSDSRIPTADQLKLLLSPCFSTFMFTGLQRPTLVV